MSDDAILLKLEEDYTCPITQACLLISMPVLHSGVTQLGTGSQPCLLACSAQVHHICIAA